MEIIKFIIKNEDMTAGGKLLYYGEAYDANGKLLARQYSSSKEFLRNDLERQLKNKSPFIIDCDF